MNIFQYLQSKYNCTTPTTITKIEAIAFGIPYPLTSGWLSRHGSREIDDLMLSRIDKKLTSRIAKRAKKNKKQSPYDSLAIQIARKKSGPVSYPPIPANYIEAQPPKQKYVDPNGPDFLTSYAWRTLRMQALKLYGPVCMCCGDSPQNGAVINVDHIKPRKHFPQLALDIGNLQILCGACNQGKANWDQTDWRPKESEFESYDPLDQVKNFLGKF